MGRPRKAICSRSSPKSTQSWGKKAGSGKHNPKPLQVASQRTKILSLCKGTLLIQGLRWGGWEPPRVGSGAGASPCPHPLRATPPGGGGYPPPSRAVPSEPGLGAPGPHQTMTPPVVLSPGGAPGAPRGDNGRCALWGGGERPGTASARAGAAGRCGAAGGAGAAGPGRGGAGECGAAGPLRRDLGLPPPSSPPSPPPSSSASSAAASGSRGSRCGGDAHKGAGRGECGAWGGGRVGAAGPGLSGALEGLGGGGYGDFRGPRPGGGKRCGAGRGRGGQRGGCSGPAGPALAFAVQ